MKKLLNAVLSTVLFCTLLLAACAPPPPAPQVVDVRCMNSEYVHVVFADGDGVALVHPVEGQEIPDPHKKLLDQQDISGLVYMHEGLQYEYGGHRIANDDGNIKIDDEVCVPTPETTATPSETPNVPIELIVSGGNEVYEVSYDGTTIPEPLRQIPYFEISGIDGIFDEVVKVDIDGPSPWEIRIVGMLDDLRIVQVVWVNQGEIKYWLNLQTEAACYNNAFIAATENSEGSWNLTSEPCDVPTINTPETARP